MTRMDRIVVLMNARGAKKRYPVPCGAPLYETYDFHGETWRVVAVIEPTTIDTIRARFERAEALTNG